MGAVVAFEIARRLSSEGSEPIALFAASMRAPGLPSPLPPLEHLPDAEFVKAVDARFAGIPEAIRNSPEVLALLLPTLRADVKALQNYRYRPHFHLGSAVYALGGEEDWTVSDEELRGWRDVTRGPFLFRRFPGGHFFFDSSRSEVLSFVGYELESLANRSVAESYGAHDEVPSGGSALRHPVMPPFSVPRK
jgi:medium-chain acyl-[acyl-carrier-protein] hydrolase